MPFPVSSASRAVLAEAWQTHVMTPVGQMGQKVAQGFERVAKLGGAILDDSILPKAKRFAEAAGTWGPWTLPVSVPVALGHELPLVSSLPEVAIFAIAASPFIMATQVISGWHETRRDAVTPETFLGDLPEGINGPEDFAAYAARYITLLGGDWPGKSLSLRFYHRALDVLNVDRPYIEASAAAMDALLDDMLAYVKSLRTSMPYPSDGLREYVTTHREEASQWLAACQHVIAIQEQYGRSLPTFLMVNLLKEDLREMEAIAAMP